MVSWPSDVEDGGGVGSRYRAITPPLRLRYMFLLAVLFAGSFVLLSIGNGTEILFINTNTLPTNWDAHYYEIDNSDDSYTIRTEGCTIPALHPFDESIKKYIQEPTRIQPCRNSGKSLIASNATHLWIDKNNFHLYLHSYGNGVYNLTCCYLAFFRPDSISDIDDSSVDNRVVYEKCIEFQDIVRAMHEFVRVKCYDGEITEDNIAHDSFHLFAIEKELIKASQDATESPQNKSAYNVILMGIDAVSRLNFHRTMPKTLAYLKRKGAIELLGYNKVGDNTFPNLIPILLGIRSKDLNKMCYIERKMNFDNCPFIWEWFKDAGYYTALGEDSAFLGTFNYEKNGFIGTPTDYYLRTFIHEAEVHVGNNKDYNSFICMGEKYFYKVLLDYIEHLTKILKSSKLFGFFWEVTMSHDYLNYPRTMDERYETMIKNLDSSDYLDNTILVMLSDHGIRWGSIRNTKQGRIEERLPFFYILVPPSFREMYNNAYNNLKLNSKRLTTPFDIHATLTDLTNLDTINDDAIVSRSKVKNYGAARSISLFLPIPSNRTCKMADIDDHWCTCHTSRQYSVQSEEARDASSHLLQHLNNLMQEHHQCAKLSLDVIIDMTEMMSGKTENNEVGWQEFMIVIRTTPGGGEFEATLRKKIPEAEWSLSGTVSRLNLYGNQSRCIHDYRLKLYCYCVS